MVVFLVDLCFFWFCVLGFYAFCLPLFCCFGIGAKKKGFAAFVATNPYWY
jgi:hypothetical protein